MIPFAASAEWYVAYFRSLSQGMEKREAEARAREATGDDRRALARTRIVDGEGRELMLTVPVAGGAPRLKKTHSPESLILSDHGNWRHIHLGALEAAYGRAPFFIHLMPLLREAYNDETDSLAGFNATIDGAIKTFLFHGGDVPGRFPELSAQARERAQEVLKEVKGEVSIIDALMRLGPQILLIFCLP